MKGMIKQRVAESVGRPLVSCILCALVSVSFFAHAAFVADEKSGDVAYLLEDSANVLYRFDLVAGQFKESIALSETPVALEVDADGIYVAYSRRVSHFSLDGATETHLKNTLDDITDLELNGDHLLVKFGEPSSFYSLDKLTGTIVDSAINGDSIALTSSLRDGANQIAGVLPNVNNDTSLFTATYDALGALGGYVNTDLPATISQGFFESAEQVEVSADTAYFDNGSYWDLTVPEYAGYLSAKSYDDIDFPNPGEPVVVRNTWNPCGAYTETTELVQYDNANAFVGVARFSDFYSRVFSYDTGSGINYYLFGLDRAED